MFTEYKYSWCEPKALERHLQGDWYHVTDVNGESVGYVIRRASRDWVALLVTDTEGGQAEGSGRRDAMKKAGFR